MYITNNTSTNVEYTDSYLKFLGKVVSVVVTYRNKPIRGRLIKLSPEHLELERLNGDITTITRMAILSVNNAREFQRVV